MAKSSSTEHKFTNIMRTFYTERMFEVNDTVAYDVTAQVVRAAKPGTCAACIVTQAHREAALPGFYGARTVQDGDDTVVEVNVARSAKDTKRQRITIRYKNCRIPMLFDAAFRYAPKEAWHDMKEAFIKKELDGRTVQYVGVVEKVEWTKAKGPNGTKGKPRPRLPEGEKKPSTVRRYNGVLERNL